MGYVISVTLAYTVVGSQLRACSFCHQKSAAAPQLTNNTAPIRGGKPLIFISFGGANEGGAPCGHYFCISGAVVSSRRTAIDTFVQFFTCFCAMQFGADAAALSAAVSASTGGIATIGIDLDIEATTLLFPNSDHSSPACVQYLPMRVCRFSCADSLGLRSLRTLTTSS